MNFTGKSIVTALKASSESDLIVHSNNLEITQVLVNDVRVKYKVNESEEEIYISDIEDESLERKISIDFSGEITDSMVGIYPCNFNHDGKDKKLIATQFESHHAREVFPCIDEPAAKATFSLTLETNKDDEVISNTTAKSTRNINNNRKVVEFNDTPIMSTYLLAFVIGEVKSLEAKSKSGVLVRTWATPDNYKNTDFALDVAVKVLDFYEDYFGIKYPLEKCDHIALPDFAAGAMENWGCITYREAGLITDEHTGVTDKQWVALVIAHELAHQWFGNLVTMKWWNDLWLNEGFASWIEYLALDKLFPEWKMWEQFTTSDLIAAQKLDSLENTHPIEVELHNPDEIRDIFDAISYQKGASVIRMLHSFVGPDNFKAGLHNYLANNAYKNTETKDLWSSLESVSKLPVTEFMSSWTQQPGFPFVSISQNNEGAHTATQSRFYIDGRKDNKQKWPIPLYSQTKNALTMINSEEKIEEVGLMANTDQGSFFMTSYSEEMIDNFITMINKQQLKPIERLGLLNDTFELAKAGYTDTHVALKLLNAYKDEDSAMTWDIIAMQLGAIRKVMGTEELIEATKPYVLELTSKLYTQLGWEPKENEDYFDTLLRPVILSLSSFANNKNATEKAISLFKDMNNPSDINPDLRAVVYNAVARQGDLEDFERLLNIYKSTKSAQERVNLVSAITNFKDESINLRVLEIIKTDSVRLQEVSYWIAYMFRNRHAKDITWEWLKINWDWLIDKFGTDIMTYSRFPKYAASSFSSREFLDNYLKFFESVETKGIDRSIKQGAETIKWQSKWREKDYPLILDFFKSQEN